MTKKLIDRQWPLAAVAVVGADNVGAGKGLEFTLPPGALLLRIAVQTTTAFNGTTPTLTVGDGTTTFANGVDISSAGAETTTGVPKFYPTGGKVSITAAGTGVTSGEAIVVAEYVVKNRGNEIAN